MAIYEVYSESVTFKYKSSLCSKSAFFSIAITLLTVLLPFLLAYRSHGFWLRSASYREQPEIHFKHRYFLHLETDQQDSPVLCSNYPVSDEFDYCTVIKSREEDSNYDGYYDKLKMTMEVETPRNLSVYSVQLVLIFDYRLQKHCLLQMESAAVIQFTLGLPINKLDVSGDLKLTQKKLLKNGVKDTRYNYSIFGLNDDSDEMFTLEKTLNSYAEREVTTNIQNMYYTWTRGELLDEPFIISLNIRYPEETLYYSPPFWQIIKWAWQQYLSLLLIFLFICRTVKKYVFSNHLVPTLKEIPWNNYMSRKKKRKHTAPESGFCVSGFNRIRISLRELSRDGMRRYRNGKVSDFENNRFDLGRLQCDKEDSTVTNVTLGDFAQENLQEKLIKL